MPVRLRPWAELMKKIALISLVLIITGCAKVLSPTRLIIPEYNTEIVSENSYGQYPKEYQKILKEYLQNNLINHEDAKVEFINKPSKSSIQQIGDIYTGYRLCLSINSRNSKLIYTGYKTHLFVINNSEVTLHLYDSGLLKIPFNLCVNRNEINSIYLNEIPDITEDMPLDEMDSIDLNNIPETTLKNKNNIYILCEVNDTVRTLYFNEYKRKLVESLGVEEFEFKDVKFSTTHILGLSESEEILVNRVSGSIIITKLGSEPVKGNCALLDDKKF